LSGASLEFAGNNAVNRQPINASRFGGFGFRLPGGFCEIVLAQRICRQLMPRQAQEGVWRMPPR